ncbi:unnamed protein product [Cylicocyclus nassatus]|uniref:Uncharacterized protein n=1 Tax=Cylicocyclus nassatus TaxID=53992 RepID=A0AA36DRB1_CYLNA|nr:unnamed protein product [Cylicocyclus nassatus]
MLRYTPVLLLIFCLAIPSCQWVLEGPTSDIPVSNIRRSHEARLLHEKLLNAFRVMDPNIADATVERIHRYYRSI